MAEATAALGIASAVIQFIDFSLKALVLCKQIRDSEKGASQANQELEIYIRDLKQINGELKLDVRLPVADRPITKARSDCAAITEDLQKLLNDVKVKSRDRNFATSGAAFRVLKNRRGIEVLQNKLFEAQKRFLSAVSIETKNTVAQILQEQCKLNDTIENTLLPELRDARNLSAGAHAKTHDKITDMATASSTAHQTTHDMLQDVQQKQDSTSEVARSTRSAVSEGLAKIEAQNSSIVVNVETKARRKELMDSLWYPEMFDRQQSISPPVSDTFAWIFDDSPVHDVDEQVVSIYSDPYEQHAREKMRGKFTGWRRCDGPLFWTSGKAGSGKSSLMSLIQSDSRTTKNLSIWAGHRELYRFAFYFWRPGSALQRSVRGLLRSLLYQLGKAKPTVIECIAATRSADYGDWTTRSLLAALRASLSQFQDDRIFLMVDGLDEFEENYDDLLDLVLNFQQEACLKLCIASRPETAILERLRLYPFLRLQDLNFEDIRDFVDNRLRPHRHLIPQHISQAMIRRAEGVFLWATLVVQDMISGALAGDDAKTLETRLSALPTRLNDLFKDLLRNLDPLHLKQVRHYLFHLDERIWSDWDHPMEGTMGLITAFMPQFVHIDKGDDLLDHCIEMSEHLVAQCKGLLEIHQTPRVGFNSSVWAYNSDGKRLLPVDKDNFRSSLHQIKFVHRSAHDFFFSHESKDDKHFQLRLTDEEIDEMSMWTLKGLVKLLQCLPVVVLDGSFDYTSHLIIAPLGPWRGISRWHRNDLNEWLDEMYATIPVQFPVERAVSRHPINRQAWSQKVNLSIAWDIDLHFWTEAAKYKGYLESRWNTLVRHPHSRAICSKLLVSFLDPGGSSLDMCYAHVLGGGRPESDTGLTTGITRHIYIWTMESFFTSSLISWLERGSLDEEFIMFNMGKYLLKDRALELPDAAPVQRQGLFLDIHGPERYEHPSFRIQVPVDDSMVCGTPMCLPDRHSGRKAHFRLVHIDDHGPGAKAVEKFARIRGKVYDECVISVCDVHVELLGTLLEESSECRRANVPYLVGTDQQISACLEQIKSEVRADRKGQLNSSQQSNMLHLVDKYLEDYWRTPESAELSVIQLAYRSTARPGLLGDLV